MAFIYSGHLHFLWILVILQGLHFRCNLYISCFHFHLVYYYILLLYYFRKLRHPNIVRFLGISYSTDDQTKKFLQIIMEYCDDNLENIVFKKTDPVPCYMFKDISLCKNSWQFYLSMMCGICNGLLHIHKLGIVHRDLKLANILVTV